MLIAILLGVCSGIIGFLPLFGGLKLTKRTTHSGVVGSMFCLLVGLLVSFVILVGAAVLCVNFNRDMSLAFVLSEVIALCVVAIGYGVWSVVRK